MKRVLVLVLCLLLLLSISNAFAYDQEITFQGIPWGSTPEEWSTILKNSYGDKINEISGGGSFYFYKCNFENNKMDFCDDIETSFGAAKINDTIGGYDISNIAFYSIFADNTLKNYDESFLYLVRVSLATNNAKKAERDLFAKLTTLYGKSSQKIKVEVYYFDELTLHCWLGTDDTYVLMGQSNPESNTYITLWYGKNIDPDEFKNQYASPTPTPEPHSEADPSDYNGL